MIRPLLAPNRRLPLLILVAALAGFSLFQDSLPASGQGNFAPGARVVLDAHNCYPYDGKYENRIERALSTGLPVSIELDLAWHKDLATGKGRSVLSHETETRGGEPNLDEYFFARVRPIVLEQLKTNDASPWPVLYLHFNFKTFEREHVEQVHAMLLRYKDWLSSAVRAEDPATISPIDYRPILVITETNETEKAVFYDSVPAGERFYVFGSAPGEAYVSEGLSREETRRRMATTPPERMLARPADNYRRWWNNSWAVVELGGQNQAEEWTAADENRLKALVDHAHGLGYMIRFYTLNGYRGENGEGWSTGYNFGTPEAAAKRWEAAYRAGVDFIATDQYEDLGKGMSQYSR